MRDILVALLQINVWVGALISDAKKIVREAARTADHGASLIVFLELALSGYSPEDLVLKKRFLEDCETHLAAMAREMPMDAVVIVGSPRSAGERACNAAVVFAGGRIAATYREMLLPNYGVFDEQRLFVVGTRPTILQIGHARIGIHICEDSWHVAKRPCTLLADQSLNGLVDLSASPYHRGKGSQREEILRKAAKTLQTHTLYRNFIGGQDELVFDGGSFAMAPDGTLAACAKQLEPDVLWIQLQIRGLEDRHPLRTSDGAEESAPSDADGGAEILTLPIPGNTGVKISKPWKTSIAPPLDDPAKVCAAFQLGLRDYVDKNGFNGTIVALSGGMDSALVATAAADAIGADRVAGITMPSRFSSPETRADAAALASNLGIRFFEIPIQWLFEEYLAQLKSLWPGSPPM